MASTSGAYFEIDYHTRSINLAVTFLNLKFVQSMPHIETNFRFW